MTIREEEHESKTLTCCIFHRDTMDNASAVNTANTNTTSKSDDCHETWDFRCKKYENWGTPTSLQAKKSLATVTSLSTSSAAAKWTASAAPGLSSLWWHSAPRSLSQEYWSWYALLEYWCPSKRGQDYTEISQRRCRPESRQIWRLLESKRVCWRDDRCQKCGGRVREWRIWLPRWRQGIWCWWRRPAGSGDDQKVPFRPRVIQDNTYLEIFHRVFQ